MGNLRVYDENNIIHVRKSRDLYEIKERILRRAILDVYMPKSEILEMLFRIEGKTIRDIKRSVPKRLWVWPIQQDW